MNGPAKKIEHFRVFADTRLRNHVTELETRYQNREVDEGLKQQAYSEHRRIFQKELSDKMEELISTENEFLRPALGQLTDRFLDQLNIDSN